MLSEERGRLGVPWSICYDSDRPLPELKYPHTFVFGCYSIEREDMYADMRVNQGIINGSFERRGQIFQPRQHRDYRSDLVADMIDM